MMQLEETHKHKRSSPSIGNKIALNPGSKNDVGSDNDVESENSSKVKRTKRNRSSRACIVCRQRKVKCDAVKCYPKKCSNCVQFNIKNCVIPAPKKRKSKKLEELLKLNPDVELSNENDEDVESNAQIFKSNSEHYPEYVENNLQERYPEMKTILLDPNTAIKQDIETIEKYAESIDWNGGIPKNLLSSFIKEHVKNHGAPITIDDIDYDYLLRCGCFQLPPADICWKYINTFFNLRYKRFPVIIEKKFRKDYKDLKNPPSLLLLQSVLYAGAKFYDEPTWNDNQRRIQAEKSEILFKRAKALYDTKIEPDSLCNLQSILLLGNYRSRNKLEIKTDSSFIRSSLDLAYAIGIHKNVNSLTNVSQDEKMLYKRIWWTIFLYDTFYSFVLCRPWAIDCIHTSDVPMIEPKDFREDINDSTTDDSPDVLYFIHSVKLSLCIRKICESISKISHSSKNAINNSYSDYLDECDQMMTDWIEQLPTSALFRINSSTNNVLNASLSLEYYGALLLLHRIHILKNPNLKEEDGNYPSWGIVFKAAHMVAVISRYIIENNHASFCQNSIPFVTSIAGSMMIYHLYNKDKTVHKIAKEDIETYLELLFKVSLDWPYASITYYSLKSVYEDKAKQSALVNNLIRQSNRLSLSATRKASNLQDTGQLEKYQSTKANPIAKMSTISTNLNDLRASSQMIKVIADLPVNSILYNTATKMSDTLSYNNNLSNINAREGIRGTPYSSSSPASTTSYAPITIPSNKYNNISMSTTSNTISTPASISNNSNNNNISNSDNSCMAVTPGLINSYTNANDGSLYNQELSPTNSSYERLKHNNSESLNMNISPEQKKLPSFLNIPNNSPNISHSYNNQSLAYSNHSNQTNSKPYLSSYDMLPPVLPLLPPDSNVHQSPSYSPASSIPPSFPVPAQESTPQFTAQTPNNEEQSPTNFDFNGKNKFNKNFSNQSAVSRKFDLVLPPDLIPGVESFNWKPEFDTSMLTFTKDDQFDPNFQFGQFFQELGL